MLIIYKATNTKTKEIYIGKTKESLNKRINKHRYEAFVRNAKNKFHQALRTFGIDAFVWETLAIAKNKIQCMRLEKRFILENNSIDQGYNTQLRKDL